LEKEGDICSRINEIKFNLKRNHGSKR